MRGYDDRALGIADDDVAGKYRDAAAADRDVEIDGMVDRQVQGRARAGAEYREIHPGDRVTVAQPAVGHHAGYAAHLHAREQNAAGGCRARVAPAIHHQHLPMWDDLDRLALRVLRIFEHPDMVEVLARRNVAQRERLADKIVARLAHWSTFARRAPVFALGAARRAHAVHALQIDIAQSALEQLRRQRRGAGALELLQRVLGKGH